MNTIENMEVASLLSLARYEVKHGIRLTPMEALHYRHGFCDGAAWALERSRVIVNETGGEGA